MANKALDVHEMFASNLAFENQILWDAYTPRQYPLFKQKLNELFRDASCQSFEQIKAMEKLREAVYKSTISQTKYTNKNLLSTFILVTVVAESTTFIQAREANTFSVHLVVRTRKCMKNDDSSKCCMIFIDEHGRVYKNWKSFMEDNLLPKGIAFAPSRGIYKFEKDKLIMESWETPACKLGRKLMATTDVVAGVGGFAAAGVSLAAVAMPITAPVMAVAGGVCIGTGIYSAIRSGWQLRTRNEHEQSIALTDRQARGCWLGVTSGVLAVSSSVANRSLAQVVLAGREVSLIRETVVNGMNITTMLISGTGVANGVLDMLLTLSDDERITKTDWLQMAASLVIFTHSVYNFRLASTIVSSDQNARVSTYRTELTGRLRQLFTKMIKGTINAQGAQNRKIDIIRLTNEVPDSLYASQITNAFSFSDLTNFCQNIVQLVEPLILNMDSFQNCVLYLMKNVGQNVTVVLMEKAKLLIDRFRRKIESFIRTTLYYETALWDLYQTCEEHLVMLTMKNLEESMSQIFSLLLSHYEEMSFRNDAVKTIACKDCDGFYQVCAID